MATISKPTATTITGKTAGGRNEKQHACEDGVGHPISAHDELGNCHVDGCACPGYASEANAPADRETDAPADHRDTVE